MRDTYVLSFTHLKDQFDADRALKLLQRVASLVKPIMQKRGWVLPVLSEFYPDNSNLHGLIRVAKIFHPCHSEDKADESMGQKIFLRLRPAHSRDSLLPEKNVAGTMLHELTHNVHSPHDELFYKYLNDLQLEYEGLQWSGWDGEGFLSVGHRLASADFSTHVPPQVARMRALDAAEQRAKTARSLVSGGRLGSSTNRTRSNARELTARAAERRLQDEKSCACGEEARREADQVATESTISEISDLALDTDPRGTSTAGFSSTLCSAGDLQPQAEKPDNSIAGSSKKPRVPKPRGVAKVLASRLLTEHLSTEKQVISRRKPAFTTPIKRSQPIKLSTPGEWSCSSCTLLNSANVIQCGACQVRRPYDEHEGWPCLLCGETGNHTRTLVV